MGDIRYHHCFTVLSVFSTYIYKLMRRRSFRHRYFIFFALLTLFKISLIIALFALIVLTSLTCLIVAISHLFSVLLEFLIRLFVNYKAPPNSSLNQSAGDLVLSVIHSRGFCLVNCPDPHLCSFPLHQSPQYYIHGGWPPEEFPDIPLRNEFILTELKPLIPRLRTYWPNLYPQGSDVSYWRHQYIKHGRKDLTPELTGCVNYFSKILSLFLARREALMTSLPAREKPYDVRQVVQALSCIHCDCRVGLRYKYVNEYKYPVLYEVRFHYDPFTLKPVGCNELFQFPKNIIIPAV